MMRTMLPAILLCIYTLTITPAAAVCPTADITGDCVVDLEDLALLAAQWLTGRGVPADMVYIPGGTFIMGDNRSEAGANESPIHPVTLSPFYMGKFTVTNAEYAEFLTSALSDGLIDYDDGFVYKANGRAFVYCFTSVEGYYTPIKPVWLYTPWGPELTGFAPNSKNGRNMANDPMTVVTWYGAAAYANWRSQREGREPCYNIWTETCDFSKNGYRLPTEAQWEYAARGGLEGKRFPWGDQINHDHANYHANGSEYFYDTSPYTTWTFHPTWCADETDPFSCPVDTFSPNGYGLYNMAGNVRQWCNDWYGSYTEAAKTDPTGPATGTERVLRGGSWSHSARECRVTWRYPQLPSSRYSVFGFRLCLNAE